MVLPGEALTQGGLLQVATPTRKSHFTFPFSPTCSEPLRACLDSWVEIGPAGQIKYLHPQIPKLVCYLHPRTTVSLELASLPMLRQTSVIRILVTVLIPVNHPPLLASHPIFTSPLGDGCRGIFFKPQTHPTLRLDPAQKSRVFSLSESRWAFQANEQQSPAGARDSSKCVTAPLKSWAGFFSPTLCLY